MGITAEAKRNYTQRRSSLLENRERHILRRRAGCMKSARRIASGMKSGKFDGIRPIFPLYFPPIFSENGGIEGGCSQPPAKNRPAALMHPLEGRRCGKITWVCFHNQC